MTKQHVLPAVLAAAVLLTSGVAFADQSAMGALMSSTHSSAHVCPGPSSPSDVHCHALVSTDQNGSPLVTSEAAVNSNGHGGSGAKPLPSGYGPVQFRTAYNLPSAPVSGTPTIGIVDAYDDANIASDLATYSSTFGLPACTTSNGCFTKVNQTGGNRYPGSNAGWALEISLDVEVAHATCPSCKILLVEASSNSFTDLLTAEDYATSHATVVSNSWGSSEFSSETSFDSHFNHPGVAITVSTGDGGYGVEYPAASQYVTAVGGTTLALNTNNTRSSETAWSGAGSGCSSYESKPAFQTSLTPNCSNRVVADVSADANPNTGAAVYDSVRYSGQSGWFQVGGTSLASPLIASIYALANNGGNTNTLYANASNLYDVTSGSNGSCGGTYFCTALSGYDGPTGLGSPNGIAAF